MKKIALILITLLAFSALADLIPGYSWPKKINYGGKEVHNPTVAQCVAAGYRLIPTKPDTPEGKRIKAESFVQHDTSPEYVQWVIEYEDIPTVPVVVITNVPFNKVVHQFTTNGQYLGTFWLDAPVTNK
jgi:hypothetical protein